MKEISIQRPEIYPPEIRELLRSISITGFFAHGLLTGSWVFPVYESAFQIQYPLKTFDIDFVVNFSAIRSLKPVDLEKSLIGLGYVTVFDYGTGLRKYSKEGFEIEFLVQRRGSRDLDHIALKQLNVTATPLPFLQILFHATLAVDLGDFRIKIPAPEALFVHKLIIAQRRTSLAKKENDLSQCKALIPVLDQKEILKIVRFFKFSTKTKKAIITSCYAIEFPPQSFDF
jgi:hypothetical protein